MKKLRENHMFQQQQQQQYNFQYPMGSMGFAQSQFIPAQPFDYAQQQQQQQFQQYAPYDFMQQIPPPEQPQQYLMMQPPQPEYLHQMPPPEQPQQYLMMQPPPPPILSAHVTHNEHQLEEQQHLQHLHYVQEQEQQMQQQQQQQQSMQQMQAQQMQQQHMQQGQELGQGQEQQQSQQAPPEDDPDRKRNYLPLHGNATTYNINSLLHRNIMESDYYRNLYQLETYHEVLQEIAARVTHVEPWQTGTSRIPSTASCLLLKFLNMQLTVKQMTGLLKCSNSDHYSPHARALGFLYLRYACPPSDLYRWFEPYFEDPEEFCPASDEVPCTMGEFVIKLLTDMQYYGTTLPRIPVLIERALRVALLLVEDRRKRRKANLKNLDSFAVGIAVRAVFSDPENEPAFYDAVIDSIEDYEDWEEFDGLGKIYWVTFSEFGNSECVDLGDMELVGGAAGRRGGGGGGGGADRDRSRSRSRDRDRDPRGGSLMDKVMQSSREASAAVGKNYAKRVATYKGSLSMKIDRHTARPKSRSRSPDVGNRGLDRADKVDREKPQSAMTKVEVSKERMEELQRLKEKYGDASAP